MNCMKNKPCLEEQTATAVGGGEDDTKNISSGTNSVCISGRFQRTDQFPVIVTLVFVRVVMVVNQK